MLSSHVAALLQLLLLSHAFCVAPACGHMCSCAQIQQRSSLVCVYHLRLLSEHGESLDWLHRHTQGWQCQLSFQRRKPGCLQSRPLVLSATKSAWLYGNCLRSPILIPKGKLWIILWYYFHFGWLYLRLIDRYRQSAKFIQLVVMTIEVLPVSSSFGFLLSISSYLLCLSLTHPPRSTETKLCSTCSRYSPAFILIVASIQYSINVWWVWENCHLMANAIVVSFHIVLLLFP